MPSKKPKFMFVMDQDFIDRIDDYRYKNKIHSRAEAIRRLIEEALQKYDKQEKKPKK
jgi:metal-responsive CopG/Arc/MetJ family transcriptional regulator